MKVGDTLQDSAGITYTLGRILGRGLWGMTYIAKSTNKTQCVFKLPYAPKDLPYGKERLAQVSRAILIEQGELLSKSPSEIFLQPIDRFTTKSGVPCLRYPVLPSMAYQIERGISLGATLETLDQIALKLQGNPDRDFIHGNLDLTNIFYHPEQGVLLSDPMSPTLQKHLPELLELSPRKIPFFAPEFRKTDHSPPSTAGDVYALAMTLYRCVMHHSDTEPNLPLEGLTRALKTAFQDQTQRHLSNEAANPRFQTRLSMSLGRFIGRALSQPTEPSPPYRFHQLAEVSNRLGELNAMFSPFIDRVGKIIWNLPISRDCFYVGESIEFSCSVDTKPQLDNYEDISCGLAIIDKADGKPIKEHSGSFEVDSHAGGRLRFSISIPNLPPSQYIIRAAFRITDSEEAPETAEATISVVSPPGFVPKERPIQDPQTLLINPNIEIQSESESYDNLPSSDPGLVSFQHEQSDPGINSPSVSPIPQSQPDPNVQIAVSLNATLDELNSSTDDPSFGEQTLQDEMDLNTFFSEPSSAIIKISEDGESNTVEPTVSPAMTEVNIMDSEDDSFVDFLTDEVLDDDSIADVDQDSFGTWDPDALRRPDPIIEQPIQVESPPPLSQLILDQLDKLRNDPISMLIAIIVTIIIFLFLILQIFS